MEKNAVQLNRGMRWLPRRRPRGAVAGDRRRAAVIATRAGVMVGVVLVGIVFPSDVARTVQTAELRLPVGKAA